jgi:hypothetical protein
MELLGAEQGVWEGVSAQKDEKVLETMVVMAAKQDECT